MADAANYLLLIDACGPVGSLAVAVLSPEVHVIGEATLPARATSERLLPAIHDLLKDERLGLQALAAIGIVNGPGSFTGVRVGLSAAKGLCEALSIPLIAISRLAVLAGKSSARDVLALLDAGRGEFYCGHYAEGACVREALATRERVGNLAEEESPPALIACEEPVVAAFRVGLVETAAEPTAADVLPHVVSRFRVRDFDDIARTDANYVRRTDLEIFAKQVRQAAVGG